MHERGTLLPKVGVVWLCVCCVCAAGMCGGCQEEHSADAAVGQRPPSCWRGSAVVVVCMHTAVLSWRSTEHWRHEHTADTDSLWGFDLPVSGDGCLQRRTPEPGSGAASSGTSAAAVAAVANVQAISTAAAAVDAAPEAADTSAADVQRHRRTGEEHQCVDLCAARKRRLNENQNSRAAASLSCMRVCYHSCRCFP